MAINLVLKILLNLIFLWISILNTIENKLLSYQCLNHLFTVRFGKRFSPKKMFSFAKIRPMNFLKFLFSRSFIKQIGLALIAIIVFSFLTLKWLKSYTNHGAFVEVPNLVGLSLDDAKTTLDNFDLRTQVQDSSPA